jgi:hypothetical protein
LCQGGADGRNSTAAEHELDGLRHRKSMLDKQLLEAERRHEAGADRRRVLLEADRRSPSAKTVRRRARVIY